MSNRVADEGRTRTSSRAFKNDYHYQNNRRKIKAPVLAPQQSLERIVDGEGDSQVGVFCDSWPGPIVREFVRWPRARLYR